MRCLLPLSIVALLISPAFAAAEPHNMQAPYAGQQNRDIKALSDEDVVELLAGRGWGFAKAAELNSVPGAVHLLELKDELGLTAAQAQKIEAARVNMSSKSKALGAEMVRLERDLDRAFVAGDLTEGALKEKIMKIAKVRGQLRLAHLVTHLQTRPLLTDHQVAKYNQLRGY